MRRAVTLALCALAPLAAIAGGTGGYTLAPQVISPEEAVTLTLRAGGRMAEGPHMAGLDLTLAPGWKTYWRAPGPAGVPPRLILDESENLRAARLRWPAPEVFDSAGERTLGYTGGVILPLELTPEDPAAPIQLKGAIEFGICRDICVPITRRLEATLEPDMAEDPAISEALDREPREAASAGVQARACAIEAEGEDAVLHATLSISEVFPVTAAVIEPSVDTLWVGQAEVIKDDGGLRLHAPVNPLGDGPLELPLEELRITLIGAEGAVELIGCPEATDAANLDG